MNQPATNAAPASPIRERAEAVLRDLVGRADAQLRTDQLRAVEALVVQRRRALVVQRTGWGKSAVYFIATVLLREGWADWRPGTPLPVAGAREAAGATVIVSPLLALMRDQVAAAQRAGINALTMNSVNAPQWPEIEAQVQRGEVDLLLVSPERLNHPVFREEVLPRLAADAALVVIDEAHCISDWGHDFRPDYRRIRTLLSQLPHRTPVLATTATANARVTADIAEQLSTASPADTAADGTAASAPGRDVLVLRGTLARDSLHLGVQQLPDAASRLAWLVSYLQGTPGSGIVYCLTVAAAEEVAERLRDAGMAVSAYTGRTDSAERERLEEELRDNRVKALVATSALGMGFDKPDLAFVVHLGAPSSPVAYYQQVGRAGRGVERAEVILLPGAEDRAIWDWFGAQGFPPPDAVREVLAALDRGGAAGGRPVSTNTLEAVVPLRRARLESMLKVLDVDGAVQRVPGGWQATGRPWAYDAPRYERVERARRAEQELMERYESLSAPDCRMAFLRRVLDDPELTADWRCGTCDLCGGLDLPQVPAEQEVSAARRAMARVGIAIEPRRRWPAGMDRLGLPELRGAIAAADRAEPGLAVGRLDGLGVSASLRDLLDSGADSEVPPSLRTPVLEVADRLAAQAISVSGEGDAQVGPKELAVVVIDSRTRPRLVRHLGHALAHHLGAVPLGVIGVRGEPGRHDVGSAFRLADSVRSLTLEKWPPRVLERLHNRHVVLVDDWTDSGWTLTVGAMLLRRAGAAGVYPLVLAQR
ncbi:MULTISPECIES: DEAD/DEAH box helicase [unclassified Actinomyces]|uniref:RecQ family ATP-dependent DNA helicase n=1 Tax=unclassified Actinomyces TaxID=2609248 RepID=UPI0013A6C3D7|nr:MULTISPECIES: DEAD/DEAH box helicase [unclassified Actinomyces]MBW3067922.1 DEAD/DEAH box helicase [Actinomyces sp. 594]NDR52787.1 DEAD/DEAH box helicase [Actinomyces sp. 565]